MDDDVDSGVRAIAALADPMRRSAYQTVVDSPVPIGRDEVAQALGVGRTLAAFHLDKLAAAGLLEVSYARRSGRSGPGAGRPAKLYQRGGGEHAVSVPPRAYRGAAELLAEAVEAAGADAALYAVARQRGRRLAQDAGPDVDPVAVLAEQGYQPEREGAEVVLRNCPFHALADQFPALVCGMNLALLEALVDGVGAQARMAPAAGRCCVVLSINKQT